MRYPHGVRARLSVVAIVRDEEAHLPEFLASHAFADEIVLIDSGSTDRTRSIAERDPKVRFHERAWNGFPQQWNRGLDLASGDWILISEADHRVGPQLRAAIEKVLDRTVAEAAFLIPRRNIIFGRWLRHGGCWPDYGYPRLVRRGAGRFDETKPIHEKLHAQGPVGILDAPFEHLSIPTMDAYLAKMMRYTSVEARAYADRMTQHGSRLRAARAVVGDRAIPLRQKLSYLRPLLPGGPALMFVWRYIVRGGFLDGREGFWFCALSATYEMVWRAKLAEIDRDGR